MCLQVLIENLRCVHSNAVNSLQATFTRDAFEQFAGMPLRLRQVVALRLHDLAAGRFQLQLQQHPGSSAALPGGCTTQHDMAQLAPAWRRRRGGISEERFTGLVCLGAVR